MNGEKKSRWASERVVAGAHGDESARQCSSKPQNFLAVTVNPNDFHICIVPSSGSLSHERNPGPKLGSHRVVERGGEGHAAHEQAACVGQPALELTISHQLGRL